MNWDDLLSLIIEHDAVLWCQRLGTDSFAVYLRMPTVDGSTAWAGGFALVGIKATEGRVKQEIQKLVENAFFNL